MPAATVIFIIFAAFIAVIAVMTLISWLFYKKYFSERYTTPPSLMFYPEDFDGLNRRRLDFCTDHGRRLAGYLYSVGNAPPRGIVVLAHGFGTGGHSCYMDCADYFAQNGYLVFTYDATGNDASEGRGINGLPQGVIDLDYALRFVKSSPDIPKNLPIMLFGHSWGGYCVSAVLNYHDDIRGVVAISGFNRSSDLVEAHAGKLFGKGVRFAMPFVRIAEILRFGKYAKNTAMRAFSRTKAAVCVVHSEDDKIVPIRYGYDIYKKKYASDPRFRFIRFTDKGHSSVYNTYEGIRYVDKLFEDMYVWRRTLDYAWNEPENRARYEADKEAWTLEHFEKSVRLRMLDKELFDGFVRFFDGLTN